MPLLLYVVVLPRKLPTQWLSCVVLLPRQLLSLWLRTRLLPRQLPSQ